MAARESAAVLEALAAVQAGMTRADAADRFGVAPSSITRALRRRKVPPMSTARKPRPPVLPPGWPLVPMKR